MNMDPDEQDDEAQRKSVQKSVDTTDQAVDDRAVAATLLDSPRKRGLQNELNPKMAAGHKRPRPSGGGTDSQVPTKKPSSIPIQRREVVAEQGKKGESTKNEDEENQGDSSGEDCDDSSVLEPGASRISCGKNTRHEEKDRSEGEEEKQSSNDMASLLYTDNIMAAAAATNDELEASGMAALNALTVGSQGFDSADGSSQLMPPSRISAAGSVSDANTTGILQQLIVENAGLRRMSEALLMELQASRNIISGLLAGRDPTTLGGLVQIGASQLVHQAGLQNNPLLNRACMENESLGSGSSRSSLAAALNQSELLGAGLHPNQQSPNIGQDSLLQAERLSMLQMRALLGEGIPLRQQSTPLSTLSSLSAASQQQILAHRMYQPLLSGNRQLPHSAILGITERLRLAQAQNLTQTQSRQLDSSGSRNVASKRSEKSDGFN
jgi:hypothetical protein